MKRRQLEEEDVPIHVQPIVTQMSPVLILVIIFAVCSPQQIKRPLRILRLNSIVSEIPACPQNGGKGREARL